MRVISLRPLKQFWEKHPDAEIPLRHWITATKSATWKSLADVRRTFRHADLYRQFTIFNIGGNKYRLIAAIHFNTQCVYVRFILTHAEYDAEGWKK